MTDHFHLNLVQAMDRLWFNQIILFSEPISLNPKTIKTLQNPISETHSSLSSIEISEEEISSSEPSPIPPQEDEKIGYKNKRPTKLDLDTSTNRSYSSSPSSNNRPKQRRYSGSVRRLQKTMSCKSLMELEYEEVKGFIDLGFIFKKEQLCPRMISVLPGLQRIGITEGENREDEIEGKGQKKDVMRPYLSEAWLIKRPDSPLLNLRMPRFSADVDMKKHIRFWARTIATVIQQES